MNKVYVVTSYPKDTASIGEKRAGFINSIWSDNEKHKRRDTDSYLWMKNKLFTYEVEEREVN